MKRLGIIGGMSWESSSEYYRLLNEGVRQRLGALHSADVVMHSLDFQQIEELQHSGDWDRLGQILADSARGLEAAGADCILLATNTMHKRAADVEAAISVPFLHIADAAGAEIQRLGKTQVALLGTRFTMEQDFYRSRLEDRFAIQVITPAPQDRDYIHKAIYNELCAGKCLESTREVFVRIIEDMAGQGAQAVVLGCTEIPLLIQEKHSPIPVVDTTRIHCSAALDMMLSGS